MLSTPFLSTYLDASTIDLCLGSPFFLQMISCAVGPDIGSDHVPVILELRGSFSPGVKSFHRARWRFPDYTKYQTLPEHDFSNQLDTDNNLIVDSIKKAASNTFKFTNGGFHSKAAKPWWNNECSQAVAYRRRVKRKLERSNSLSNYIEYKSRAVESGIPDAKTYLEK